MDPNWTSGTFASTWILGFVRAVNTAVVVAGVKCVTNFVPAMIPVVEAGEAWTSGLMTRETAGITAIAANSTGDTVAAAQMMMTMTTEMILGTVVVKAVQVNFSPSDPVLNRKPF